MRNDRLSILLGLTTSVALCQPLPAQAEPKIYQNLSGQENLNLDREGIAALESIGLSFDSANSSALPDPGFELGIEFLPPSQDPDVRGSTSFFSYDSETKEYAFQGEREEFTGGLLFNVDTNKLSLDPVLELGNFSVSYSSTGEVALKETISTDLPLFTVFTPPGSVPVIDLKNQTSVYSDVEIQASQTFSDFLAANGATTPITGLTIAEGRLERGFTEVSTIANPEPVPEPGSALGILTATGAALALRKWRRAA